MSAVTVVPRLRQLHAAFERDPPPGSMAYARDEDAVLIRGHKHWLRVQVRGEEISMGLSCVIQLYCMIG